MAAVGPTTAVAAAAVVVEVIYSILFNFPIVLQSQYFSLNMQLILYDLINICATNSPQSS